MTLSSTSSIQLSDQLLTIHNLIYLHFLDTTIYIKHIIIKHQSTISPQVCSPYLPLLSFRLAIHNQWYWAMDKRSSWENSRNVLFCKSVHGRKIFPKPKIFHLSVRRIFQARPTSFQTMRLSHRLAKTFLVRFHQTNDYFGWKCTF